MPSQRLTKLMLDLIYYSGGATLANKTLRGLGAILVLHRVGNNTANGFSPNSHLSVTPEFLEEALRALSSTIYEFVSLDEAVERIMDKSSQSRLRRPFLAVTLDDGYRDNLVNAAPLFRKYNVPYTIYVAPGLVDGRANLWWEDLEHLIASRDRLDMDMPGGRKEFTLKSDEDKTSAFSELLEFFSSHLTEVEQRHVIKELCWMHKIDFEGHRANSIMTWKELSELAKDPLCTLGAHTIGHYAVARLSKDDAIFELEESRRLIELETGSSPKHFAYPYGYPAAAGTRDFDLARECGYISAVTTRHGVCYRQHQNHMTALPRISLNGNFQKMRYVRTLLSGATARIANRGTQLNIS
jgi:peptidoglycan/xylan/chitin deacetylase (PgdA/CDA1 family)